MSKYNPVANAINYLFEEMGRWEAFTRFLDDVRICLTNNAAERAVRGVALGRKAWLFAGSPRGGDRAAFMYSLIVTAKMSDIDPQAWLADVLARLPVTLTGEQKPMRKLPGCWPSWARHLILNQGPVLRDIRDLRHLHVERERLTRDRTRLRDCDQPQDISLLMRQTMTQLSLAERQIAELDAETAKLIRIRKAMHAPDYRRTTMSAPGWTSAPSHQPETPVDGCLKSASAPR